MKVRPYLVAGWRWTLAALDFLSVLEDSKRGQPRRLSQTRLMVWGAMVVGGYLVSRITWTGEPISWTETGVIGMLTVAASLMKLARDQRRGRSAWTDDDTGIGGEET